MTYTVVLLHEPEGGYSVVVPALPGCHTQGETVPDALSMAREAIALYLESLAAHNEPIPGDSDRLEFDMCDCDEGLFFRLSVSYLEGVGVG